MTGNRKYSKKIKESLQKLKQLSAEEEVVEAFHAIERLKEVNTDHALRRIRSRIDKTATIRRLYDRFSRVAAILVFPLLFLSLWSLTRQKPAAVTEFVSQEITAPKGIRSQVVLPDRTIVWLNSGSSLSYQTPFVHNGSREVKLSGEALFEVTHDVANPFIVHAGVGRLEVLGTTFNIKAYAEEPEIEVALLEGKLQFVAGEGPGKSSGVILSPGERAVYEKDKGIAVSRESLEKYAAWRYGKLVFDETPMLEVADCLERWFGVEVIVTDPRLNAYRFTTTFDNQSLPQVLELLELSSPLSARYEPGKFNRKTNTGESGKVYFSYRPIKSENMEE